MGRLPKELRIGYKGMVTSPLCMWRPVGATKAYDERAYAVGLGLFK